MTQKTQQLTPIDLYQQVTDQLIAALETSTDWVMPWHKAKLKIPQNALTKNPYKGINILSLWMASCEKRYTSPFWGTYKQWQDLGANVRKGEKGHPIVFYKDFETEEKNEETEESDTVKRFVLKSSSVFNAQQVDGFEIPEEEAPANTFDPLEHVETFISNTGAPIVHGFFSAFYRVSEDVIAMPNPGRFMETETGSAKEAYYSTLLHELAHWTGHQSRLNRLIPTARFGSESYALEELIAEITSAFLCAELGITASPRQDHANYIASWLKVLKNDKRAIFYAARQATLAAEFLKEEGQRGPNRLSTNN